MRQRFGWWEHAITLERLIESHQAPFFISMPLPLGRALFAVSLLLLLTAAGAFSLLRR